MAAIFKSTFLFTASLSAATASTCDRSLLFTLFDLDTMDPEVQHVPMSRLSSAPRQELIDNDDIMIIDDDNTKNISSGAPRDVPLELLEKAVENACETLATLATNVIDFSFDSQHVLFSKVNEFVRDLSEIDQCGKNVTATIPIDVIQVIDKGRNPELCTFQMLESCADASNVVRGKLSAVQSFKNELDKSIQEARSKGCLQPVKDEDFIKILGIDPSSTNGPTNGPTTPSNVL